MKSRTARRRESAARRWIGLPLAALCAGLHVTPADAGTASAQPAAAPAVEAPPQDTDPRRSGQNATIFLANNLEFRFVGDAGFHIRNVEADLRANDPARPIVMDDPASFRVDVTRGEISMTGANLAALLNRELTAAKAPIRNARVTVGKNGLEIGGELLRGGSWLPLTLTGRLTQDSPVTLSFAADSIVIDGVEVQPSLHVARLTVQDLVPLRTRSISLQGNRIVIRVDTMLPPPQFRFAIRSLGQTDDRIVMVLARGPDGTGDSAPTRKRDAFRQAGTSAALRDDPKRSYLILAGGDVRIERVLATDSVVTFSSEDPAEVLTFPLYDYRSLLASCAVRLSADGDVSITRRPNAQVRSGAHP
ncbi:hypothetical protein [Burkholderia alba]|uniref:hypothetical protein n=1 Tax=Burkholderia alba TaxID=2683677 RepID=UPI002B060DA4|nr:hypothetical protein [Burkholderia alba]